jgi:hypothetical protein
MKVAGRNAADTRGTTTMQNDPTAVFMTREEAGELLRFPPRYLTRLKNERRGPRVCKFGDAARSPVRYRLADVLAWTADPAGHEREVWGDRSKPRRRPKR